MSNLSADIGGVQPVTQVTQGSSGGGADILGSAVGALAQGLGALTEHWQKTTQLKRQQVADAREAESFQMKKIDWQQGQQDRAVGDQITRQANAANQNLYNPPVGVPAPVDFTAHIENGMSSLMADPTAAPVSNVSDQLSPAALATLSTGATKLNNFSAAVDQGKMSPVALQSQADMLLNNFLTAHPEANAAAAAEQLKKLGVDNGLFRMIKSDQDRYTDAQARDKQMRDDAFKEGSKWLSPDEAASMSQDQVVAVGQQHLATETAQRAKEQALDYSIKQQAGNMAQYNNNKELYSDQVQQVKHEALTSYLNPYMQQFVQFNNMAPDGGQDPNYELQRAKLVPLIQQKFEIALNKTASTITDPTARNAFITSERSNFQATYMAPMQSRDPAIGAALKGISQYLGFKADLAMPMLAQLKAAGTRIGDIPQLLQALPPSTLKALTQEYSGIATNRLDPQAGKIVLNHMVGVLNGTDSLTNINDPKLRQAVTSTSANMVMGQAQQVAAGKGDARSYGGTMKTLILASASVTRGTPDVVSRALGSIANNSNIAAVNKLLSDPGTHPDGVEIAAGSRAAVAHLVANSAAALRGQQQQEKYQLVRYNADTGQYRILFNDSAWARDHGSQTVGNTVNQVNAAFGRTEAKPQPSTALQNLVASTNQGLNFLAHTTAWDKTAPEAGESARDVANFYATGTLTPKMKAQAESAANSRKQTGNALDIGKTLEQSLTRHMTDDIPTGTEGGGDHSNVPFSAVKGTIEHHESRGNADSVVYGLSSPRPLTSMSMGEVNDFQRGPLRAQTKGRRGDGDVGSTGVGAYQFESKTLAQNAQEVFGADWRSVPFTRANQERVAEHLYNKVRGNRGALSSTWAAFNGG